MAFFQNDEDKQDQNQSQQLGPSTSSAAPASNAPVQPTPEQKQGSGRFTNLQQYLSANSGGGQQLASGIGSNIQKSIDPSKKDSQDYNQKVAQGIQQGQQTLATGTEGLNQLKDIGSNITKNTDAADATVSAYGNGADLGINKFTQDPNYNQFKTIQAGNGINENALNLNQQSLNNASNQYYNTANNALTDLGTEGGRFAQLQKAFGGTRNPNYNNGQQRLDQLFLKQDGIGGLKNQVGQEVQNANQLVSGAKQSGQQVGNVVGGEQQLIQDINNTASDNEKNYTKMLDSYVPGVNKARDATWDNLNTALQNKGQGLTAQQIASLGVTAPTRAYNVFNQLTGASDVATKNANAQGFGDVATNQDVQNYKGLADILGLTPEQLRLTNAGNLGNAYDSRTDDGALTSRLASADTNYQQHLKDSIKSAPSNTYGDAFNNNGTLHGQEYAGGARSGQPKAYLDQALSQFIKDQGSANVIDPTSGLKNVLAGVAAPTAGKYSYSTADSANDNYNYNSNVDNQLRDALDKIVKQQKF